MTRVSLLIVAIGVLTMHVEAVEEHAAGGAVEHKAGEIVVKEATLEVSANEHLAYELGTLYVPENRADPKSRLIGVGFARFKAATPSNTPPTFHLPGGPGSSYLPNLRNGLRGIQAYRQISDVVFIDQRGYSEHGDVMRYSYRTEGEAFDQPASIERNSQAFAAVARAAVADFEKKGFDLRGYTVNHCAEDVNDLRKALGYAKITLVGTSYGSQWSFATMRLHPEIVARAVLSGVEPLNDGYDMPSLVLDAMKRYWKAAEQDAALKPYIPACGLEGAAKEVFKRLEKEPLTVKVKDGEGGSETSIVLGLEDLQRDFLHKAPDGPAFILALYHEHYEGWAKSVLARRKPRQDTLRMIGPLIDSSLGVTPEREKALRSDPATAFLGQWNWHAYIATKDLWPSPDVGDAFRTPVETEIPVVFAQGDWDTQTPVENTLGIAKHFPRSRVIIVEKGGHGVLGNLAQGFPKEWAKIEAFVRTGDLPELPERVTLGAAKFTVPDFPAPAAK